MAGPNTPPPPPPPDPPPPPPVVTDRSIWEPGGDPGQLRAAATQWRAMAATLTAVAAAGGAAATAVQPDWKGDASDAFATWWEGIGSGVGEGATAFGEIAASLDQIADEIERVNDEIHDLYVAIAATAVVSIAASFITFGASAAAGAALAARNAATAANLVRTLGTFLTGMRVTFTAFKGARFAAFWSRWAVAAGTNTAITGTFKLVMNGQNPFDADSWTLRDATSIVVGSTLGAGTTTIAPATAARPFATGFGTGAAGSTVTDVWVNGQPFSVDTLRNALINGVASGAAGVVTKGVVDRWGGPPPRVTGPMDLDPRTIVIPGRPVPGDPADLIVPGRPTPGDPADLVVPGRPTPGDPADLIVAGRPTPGDPADLFVPGRPPVGEPPAVVLPGAPPTIDGPARIYLPGEPAPRPIIAGPPVTPLQHIPAGEPQKQTLKMPLDLGTRIAKDDLVIKPIPVTPSGPVTGADLGPWPTPPPPPAVDAITPRSRQPVGAGAP